jgi:hypothetical protein
MARKPDRYGTLTRRTAIASLAAAACGSAMAAQNDAFRLWSTLVEQFG